MMALSARQRYLSFLNGIGVDLRARDSLAPVHQRTLDLGNCHVVPKHQGAWGRPSAHWVLLFDDHHKAHCAEIRRKFDHRFGHERALRIGETSRNPGMFPNVVINGIAEITIRAFYCVSPDYMEANAWALAPADESAEDSALRPEKLLIFPGSGLRIRERRAISAHEVLRPHGKDQLYSLASPPDPA